MRYLNDTCGGSIKSEYLHDKSDMFVESLPGPQCDKTAHSWWGQRLSGVHKGHERTMREQAPPKPFSGRKISDHTDSS